jgi:hypothetical protein
MRGERSPKFFASFKAQDSIVGSHQYITDDGCLLSITSGIFQNVVDLLPGLYLLGIKEMPDGLGDVVHFPVTLLSPALKIPPLAIIPIVCKPEFRPDKVYVLVVGNHPAVIIHGMMPHRPGRQYSKHFRRREGVEAYIPMSRRMSWQSGLEMMRQSISHE